MIRAYLKFASALIALQLGACSASPALHYDALTQGLGFQRLVIPGDPFRHVLYTYIRDTSAARRTLHVYLEGDGTPWVRQRRIAQDPTPRKPLMPKLMALDSAPSILLGRPCYHGLTDHPDCTPLIWTHARYSEQVVHSLQVALQRFIADRDYQGLVLIGHSGGGTLAMLLAEQLPQTQGVLTIAGNLDTVAWAELHGYTPLKESLNPATRPPLSPEIVQLHLVGAKDTVVPPALIAPVSSRQPNIRFREIKNYSHTCCWQQHWPEILEELTTAMASRHGNNGARDRY